MTIVSYIEKSEARKKQYINSGIISGIRNNDGKKHYTE